MAQNFIVADRDQAFLLPPDLRDWVEPGHLAWFVVDAVGELDLAAFCARYRRDGWGRPAYDPAVMVALLVYGYAVGVRSARAIERRCVEDVAFRVVAGNLRPDHATIARFRAEHEQALAGLFGQVLAMCRRAGLVRAGVVAVDSTKIAANASGLQNKTYEDLAREILQEAAEIDAAEDELYGQARGDELPPELADPTTRRARIRELMDELDAEQKAEQAQRQAMLDRRAEHERRTGRRPLGRPPIEHPKRLEKLRRVNLTDPDSRSVKTPRGFIQGYNAQLVAADGQIIVAADVTIGSPDQGQLAPMVAAAQRELDAAGAPGPDTVLADAGYWRAGDIQQLTDIGLTVLVPPDAHTRSEPLPGKRGGLYHRMRDRLAAPDAAALYRRRMTMIEPIFGHTKANRRIERFHRRGLDAVRSEWRLIAATHNLLKLHTAVTTA
ncbi:MAG TPA: IS1182 family transposase [Thermomicrobiales bacterium]|nr:IS1182 family transposase [Thermomicrobiales bacterium]